MKNFKKYANKPVFGSGEIGTAFDVYVTKEDNQYRMDFSWRRKKACAVTFSKDGIHWSEPQITLAYDESTGWEDDLNRNCVLKIDGVYKMWYTGQARGYSYIGYAESTDGIHFERKFDDPIMIPEYPWEGESVMNPCVLYENGEYRMWYSAGETYEPNVLAYATSKDGIHWNKKRCNPIFVCDPNNTYEQERVGGCQVMKVEDEYYIFCKLLRQYAVSHSITMEDGTVLPWIDEVKHPHRDEWSSRSLLKDWGWKKDLGGEERGKDYNHSTFCDLVICGIAGVDPKAETFTVQPNIPEDWDYMKLSNLHFRGNCYTVIYDKTGEKYGVEKGIVVLKEGQSTEHLGAC